MVPLSFLDDVKILLRKLLKYFITLAISKCYGKVRVFFPRDNSLVSDRKSHNSDFFGLAVRCLLFNPKGPGSNPCPCANFFYKIFEAEDSQFFDNMRLPLPPFRLFETYFRKFFNVPKGFPFIFLIFCNRTNVKKFKRVSSFRFFGTMRLLKNRIFFESFSKFPHGPIQFF